jgi:hypothetical protein
VTGDQLVDHATQPARVDRGGVELPNDVRPGDQTDEQHREVGVLGVPTGAFGKPADHRGELGDDLGVQRGEPLAELRPAERRDTDFGEEHAPRTVGGKLEKQEVEPPCQRVLGIEDAELGHERRAQVFDHLIDGGDQQVFLRHEVVVNESGGEVRLGCDALHGRFGDAVLENGGTETFDDLTPTRSGQTRTAHR